MIKRDELEKTNSCLNKAKDDEPIFVLRAHDALAPVVVKYWAQIAQDSGTPSEKIRDAWELANMMKQWPDRKLPD